GPVKIGGGSAISVQSMTKTDTRDIKGTSKQISALVDAGCELIRLAVPDLEAAQALATLCHNTSVPLIADIHFDYRLALAALKAGVAGLRLNPGNIGGPERVREVALAAKERQIPIRIGVNAGSLEPSIKERYGGINAAGMVESALNQAKLLEQVGHRDIILSLKSSNVLLTVDAYRMVADECDYPLHVGITEAGTVRRGTVRSAVGMGILLNEGIGDTIRVSLTSDPVEEVKVGYEILRSLELRQHGPDIIACPTCGRCEIDLDQLVKEIEAEVAHIKVPLKIAIMGCAVNGPGEAAEADVGVAGGRGAGLIFRRGQVIRKVPENELVEALLSEIEAELNQRTPNKK
ncbi:MAG TPA: flavodoxin-dependent (E)-4-hydroxy-3-methylbut-2-enyl-diphosphate synthase, partial [bacterium]|nr:flavodoxin-dependent (E)-4-hydroxy-3-methylbut-2-enyl-diphosphate synthase [bacterium]